MKYSGLIISFGILLIILIFYLGIQDYFEIKGFEKKRSEILSEMNTTLDKAIQSGEYRCCIVPPCKMCFLGNWIFEDGKCNCDTLMVEAKWDQVCPECKRGIEEGKCKSEIDACPIES